MAGIDAARIATWQVDRDHLARDRMPVLHPRAPDRRGLDLEMPREVMDQFGMGESLLLHEQVQVLTLPARLVEREFLDEEVLLLGLDRTGDLGDVEQPALGKCGRDLEWHL